MPATFLLHTPLSSTRQSNLDETVYWLSSAIHHTPLSWTRQSNLDETVYWLSSAIHHTPLSWTRQSNLDETVYWLSSATHHLSHRQGRWQLHWKGLTKDRRKDQNHTAWKWWKDEKTTTDKEEIWSNLRVYTILISQDLKQFTLQLSILVLCLSNWPMPLPWC